MKVRYFIDSETGAPHIYNHDVSEREVEAVLAAPGEDRPGSEEARVAIGRTLAGRLLRVIYVRTLNRTASLSSPPIRFWASPL